MRHGMSSPRGTRSQAENFRRGGFLAQEDRYSRAEQFLRTTWELFDSWRGDEILADKESGTFLKDARAGSFEHHDAHFDITGQFNVPRSPQGRPVIFQAGDSNEGREFAASSADAIFGRHATLDAGREFYADVKGRLARYGRSHDQLLVLPAATFVLGDTDEEARELAHQVRLQQVSGQTAINFLEQLWNRDLSGYDPDGPLPDIDPLVGENTVARGRASVRMYRDPLATAAEWRARAMAENLSIRQLIIEVTGRQSFVGVARHRGRGDQRVGTGRCKRWIHPCSAHHSGRSRPVRRHGGTPAAGKRCVPRGIRGHDAARQTRVGAPRQQPERPGGGCGVVMLLESA